LTGAIKSPDDFAPDDYRRNSPRFMGENFQKNLELVETVRAMATDKGITPAQVALAWLLHQGEHVVCIPGTRKQSRFDENQAANDGDLVLIGHAIEAIATAELEESARAVLGAGFAFDAETRRNETVHEKRSKPPSARGGHPVRLQSAPQCVCADAKRLGSCGSIAPKSLQGRKNVATLHLREGERLSVTGPTRPSRGRTHLEGQIPQFNLGLSLREHDSAFDRILEFSHVARPRVGMEGIEDVAGQRAWPTRVLPARLRDE